MLLESRKVIGAYAGEHVGHDLLLTQLALNVFGSLDILPFTGVTFPFVSRGGSSLIACWMLLSYIKAADTRRGGSFVVRPAAQLWRGAKPKAQKKGGRGA